MNPIYQTWEFITACREWETTGLCPFQLVDFFLEKNLDSHADAIRWALEPGKYKLAFGQKGTKPRGPAVAIPRNMTYFWDFEHEFQNKHLYHYDLPLKVYIILNPGWYNTFIEAIIAFLEAWVQVYETSNTADR